jgi:hypothetical protein
MGVLKSKERIELEALDLVVELKSKTLKEIAKKYKTTISIVHKVLTQQMMDRTIGFKKIFDNEDDLDNESIAGSWMHSQQRENYRQILIQGRKTNS